MIDDLFTELTVAAVERLLHPAMPREEADFGLARLATQLATREDVEKKSEPEQAWPTGSDAESRLLDQYLDLGVNDLQEISPPVHEWLLERLSHHPDGISPRSIATLRNVYFLFPDSSVRYDVVGLLLQAERQRSGMDHGERPVTSLIPGVIQNDAGMDNAEKTAELTAFADLLLDYLDVFPAETERALTTLVEADGAGSVREHLRSWADRLGGDAGASVKRAVD